MKSHVSSSGVNPRPAEHEQLRLVLEAAPVAIVMVDRRGRLTLTNAQAERLFGYTRAELLGESVEMLVPERFREAHPLLRQGYLALATTRAMGAGRDLFGLRKDGREVPIEIGLNPIQTPQGDFVLAAIIDISERKRAEELRLLNAAFGQHALGGLDILRLEQEAAELIARTMNAPFVGIGTLDLDEGTLRVEAGVGWPRLRTGAFALDVLENSQAGHTVRTGQPSFFERVDDDYPFVVPDALRGHGIVSSGTIPIQGEHSIVGMMSIDSDQPRVFSKDDIAFLTGVATVIGMAIDRDRRERRIAQLNVELQQRYDELESFSYSVAHDLRAPLRSVAGFAEALQEDYASVLDKTATRYLNLIVAAGGQMGGLIDALLSLSRVSRQEISRSMVDLSAMARTIVGELQASDPARNAAVVLEPGLQVEGDAQLLRLVLQNLLGNAWKFTRGRDPACIAFSATQTRDQTTFRVEDNGIGFATAHPQELFTPFKRLHASAFEGLGIGLATVARIVHRHGGRVWAESEPGSGARFYFTIGQMTT